MDPNANLARLRELTDPAHGSRHLLGDEGYIFQLVDHVKALDEHLKHGGFLPSDWAPKPMGMATIVALPAVRELAIQAIIHRYELDGEGEAQLRADVRGELDAAVAAAIFGDWATVEWCTVHVRAALQLRQLSVAGFAPAGSWAAVAHQEGYTGHAIEPAGGNDHGPGCSRGCTLDHGTG
jgi:hypothetical protein